VHFFFCHRTVLVFCDYISLVIFGGTDDGHNLTNDWLTLTSVATTSSFWNFDRPKIWMLKAEIFSASHAHHPVTPSSKHTKITLFRCILLGALKSAINRRSNCDKRRHQIGHGTNNITFIYKFLDFRIIRKTFVNYVRTLVCYFRALVCYFRARKPYRGTEL